MQSSLSGFLNNPEELDNEPFKSALLEFLANDPTGRKWLIEAELAGPETSTADDARQEFERLAASIVLKVFKSALNAVSNLKTALGRRKLWQAVLEVVKEIDDPAVLGIYASFGKADENDSESRDVSLYAVHNSHWLPQYASGIDILNDIVATALVAYIYEQYGVLRQLKEDKG